MNSYTVEFFSICPTNNVRIKYKLMICTNEIISVEKIIDCVSLLNRGFHEDFADQLFREFRGEQTLVAEHHGVLIKTERE